jgi:ribosome-associated translation inhibitor RaiA
MQPPLNPLSCNYPTNDHALLWVTDGLAAAATVEYIRSIEARSVLRYLKRVNYSTSLSLHFPQQTLHAEEQSRDVKGAIRLAFDEVIRQVDRFKSKLRGERRWSATKYHIYS